MKLNDRRRDYSAKINYKKRRNKSPKKSRRSNKRANSKGRKS